MEIHVVERNGSMVALLDDDMTIVKPVYNYLKFQKQKDRAINTLKAQGTDLKIFWEFLKHNGLNYKEVTPKTIAMFIDYLRSNEDDFLGMNVASARTPKTINRILSSVHGFYQYQADMEELDNPMLSHEINRPQSMFKELLYHARKDNKTTQSIFKIKESDYKVHLVTDAEMEAVLSRLTKKRDILLYKMLFLTGARIQEILDLEMESIPIPDTSKQVGLLEQIKSKGKYRDLYALRERIEELESDKDKLIAQLVDYEEIKDENERLKAQINKNNLKVVK